MSHPPATAPAASPAATSPSPIHAAILKNNLPLLHRLLSTLPTLSPPSVPLSSPSARLETLKSATISALLDRRDAPDLLTPLHLAVRLNSPSLLSLLLSSGADPSLHNSLGWTPLQDAIHLRRSKEMVLLLHRWHRVSAARKWRRRAPEVVDGVGKVRDFYMEIRVGVESRGVPGFVSERVLPSDTVRVWKRGGAVRADTSVDGFDGLRVVRRERSVLFLDEDAAAQVPGRPLYPGALLVLEHQKKEIWDALEIQVGEDGEIVLSADEVEELVGEQAAKRIVRPGLDVTEAELVGRTNWRKKEKVEMVGEWKARLYEMHNVIFSIKSRKPIVSMPPMPDLVIDDDKEEGFLVAEMPSSRTSRVAPRRSCSEISRSRSRESRRNEEDALCLNFKENGMQARHSCYESREQWRSQVNHEDGESGDIEWNFSSVAESKVRSNVDIPQGHLRRNGSHVKGGKEKETVKNLRPLVWLTEDFPLKTEELIPLLDVLANKIKAIRRLREVLTTKFPAGSFPVKVAIPVVPAVKVVVTFTKFVELPSREQFFTPLSSPGQFTEDNGHINPEHGTKSAWLRWGNNPQKNSSSSSKSVSPTPQAGDMVDPFAIPPDYTWVSSCSKNQKKSKSKKVIQR